MATKRDGCSTYEKIGPDEPFFVLRAQDKLAHLVVRYWVMLAEEEGVVGEKLEEAEHCMEAMRAWPTRKVPD